jgi:hypothetical protein
MKRGKTHAGRAGQVQELLDSIEVAELGGLGDRAAIAVIGTASVGLKSPAQVGDSAREGFGGSNIWRPAVVVPSSVQSPSSALQASILFQKSVNLNVSKRAVAFTIGVAPIKPDRLAS